MNMSAFTDPLLPSSASNASNASLPLLDCFFLSSSIMILRAFSVTSLLLLLPLSVLVLCLGLRRWRRRRRPSSALTHSDVLAHHMAAMELTGLLGCLLYCAGLYSYGFCLLFSTWCVKIHFHALTCVERYLAVVHPVSYLGLKSSGGVRVRRLSVACLWLLCLVWGLLVSQTSIERRILVFFCLSSLAFAVTCFCCVSVLRALGRRGPGESGGDGRARRLKRRALVTVATIMAVLWLGLGGMLVCNALVESRALSHSDGCAVRASAIWFSLPSSLVLPLLYLHRAGKLPGISGVIQRLTGRSGV